jgi:hypothetical protein
MIDTEARFVGWFRPSRSARWERLAEGPTYGDCWAVLLERLPAKGAGGESVILPAGKHPDQAAARRGQPT